MKSLAIANKIFDLFGDSQVSYLASIEIATLAFESDNLESTMVGLRKAKDLSIKARTYLMQIVFEWSEGEKIINQLIEMLNYHGLWLSHLGESRVRNEMNENSTNSEIINSLKKFVRKQEELEEKRAYYRERGTIELMNAMPDELANYVPAKHEEIMANKLRVLVDHNRI